MELRLFGKRKTEEEVACEYSPPEEYRGHHLIDYDVYVMDKKEKTRYILLAAAGVFAFTFVFFQNVFISLLFCPAAFLYPRYKCKDLIEKRKRELNLQFKDALYSLSSALSVGRSLESAFKAALNDLKILYPDEETYINKEFEFICRRIEMNEPVERALQDFSGRANLEDIKNFVDVMVICKRTGGNLVEVIKNTSNIISDKMEIEQEISLLLSNKKYEQKVINIMPVVIIGLITFGGSGYMDPLFNSGAKGYFIITVALGILAASYVLSKKIMDIRV